MRILLILALALPVFAQPTITVAPVVDQITESSARFRARFSSAASKRFRIGTTSGVYSDRSYGGGVDFLHSATGLLPSTTYYYRMCATDGSETCSNEATFQTTADTSPEPVPPTVPAFVAPTWSQIKTVTTCNGTGTGSILWTWNSLSRGEAMLIPPSLRCSGGWNLPAKGGAFSGDPTQYYGILGGDSTKRVPFGVELPATDDADSLTTIVNGNLKVYQGLPATPYLGVLVWNTGDARPWKLTRGEFIETLPAFTVDNTADYITLDFSPSTHGLSVGNILYLDQSNATSLVGSAPVVWQGNGIQSVAEVINSNKVRMNLHRNGTWTSGGRARKVGWVQVPYTSGANLPAEPCPADTWFVRDSDVLWNGSTTTDPANTSYYCDSDQRWNHVYLSRGWYDGNQIAGGAVFQVNSEGTWIEGFRFTTPNVPKTDLWSRGTVFESGGEMYGPWSFTSMIWSWEFNYNSSLDLTVHQNHFYSPDPVRVETAVKYFGPFNFVGNRSTGFGNDKQPGQAGGNWACGTNCGSFIRGEGWGNGPGPQGPVRIEANYLEYVGVGTFFPTSDNSPGVGTPGRIRDVLIRRNTFEWPNRFRMDDPEWLAAGTGLVANGRHHLEMKDCTRCEISGNVFKNSWSSKQLGAVIGLHSPWGSNDQTISCTAGNCGSSSGGHEWALNEKFLLAGQVYTVTALSPFTITPPDTVSGNPELFEPSHGTFDIIIENNTFEDVTYALTAYSDRWMVPYNIRIKNNKATVRKQLGGPSTWDKNGTWQGGWSGNRQSTADTFNGFMRATAYWRRAVIENNIVTINGAGSLPVIDNQNGDPKFVGNFVDRHNIWQAVGWNGGPNVYSDYTLTGEAYLNAHYGRWSVDSLAISYAAIAAGNPSGLRVYRTDQSGAFALTPDGCLPYNSPYKAGGAQGNKIADMGLNCVAKMDAAGEVRAARVLSPASTTATVAFRAPSTTGCPVRLSSDGGSTWGSPIANAGGAKNQSVSLTGLTTATVYTVQILCQVEQPRVVFRTT